MKTWITLWALLVSISSFSQDNFNYSVSLEPMTVDGMPGLHSFAFGQANGKWLLVGGRIDGLHARQPFASFPAASNNANLYVVDVNTNQLWTAPLTSLSTTLQEQLQSTNMCHLQVADTLYFIGGYAHAASVGSKITFPNLTTISISATIDAIINGTDFTAYFKQVEDDQFAVTGGYLGYLNGEFYLAGGHRFDGNYNPMGNPTYTQTYTNAIRKFTINNQNTLTYSLIETITDDVHLHRRDYNFSPQIFPDGSEGFTMWAGVFQVNVDAPILYPIDITAFGYTPITEFNQYLSNYHSAKATLFDAVSNEMYTVFFGGMSQYYYQNDNLVEDAAVPFVRTISRMTRDTNGNLTEYLMPVEMPGLEGSSAEFIPNEQYNLGNEIIHLAPISSNSFIIGYIVGGIESSSLNPFSVNQTSQTNASPTIYAVRLTREDANDIAVEGPKTAWPIQVYPNPVVDYVHIETEMTKHQDLYYLITDASGRMVANGVFNAERNGKNTFEINIAHLAPGTYILNTVAEGKYYNTKRIVKGKG